MRVRSHGARTSAAARHAALGSAAGLGFGYLGALVSALWLKWAAPQVDVVWNVVSPAKLASWILTMAHGVPLGVATSAGLEAPEAVGTIGRLQDVIGRDEVSFEFSVGLVPLTVLAGVGLICALAARRAAPSSAGQLLRWTAVAGCVHAAILGLAAWTSSSGVAFRGELAPDLGLGAASGTVGVILGPSPAVAAGIGLAWGCAFALAGGLSSLRLRTALDPQTRVVLRGWIRGLGVAVAVLAAGLGLAGLFALLTGRAPSFALFALGGWLLSGNAVAAALVAAHGVSMGIALDAGPFTGWERMDLANFGAGGDAPALLWLMVMVPVAAGVFGGRFCARRSSLRASAIAWRFGGLWGLGLAVLALLLRVRVLTSVSVGSLDLGGGSVAFDPLVVLAAGFVWGTASSYAGARLGRVSGAASSNGEVWLCPTCRLPNASTDRYCVSCGGVRS